MTVVDEKYVSQTKYTLPLDLPTSGLLSTLWLIVHARTDSAVAANEPFMKYLISSISVNQAGQEALNAARPQAFEASYYYKTGKMPRMGQRMFTGNYYDMEEVIPILFGNKVDDLDYYIDLAKLNDPKLSVTYDLATKGLQDRTLWDTTYFPRFSVIADFLEGPAIPESKGYYSLRQIEAFDVVNDLINKTELKGARPIKRILPELVVASADYEFRNSLDSVRIYGDNEAWVPFRMTPERWANYVRMKFGLCETKYQIWYCQDDRFTDMVVAERVNYLLQSMEDPAYAPISAGGSGLKANIYHVKVSDGAYGAHNYVPSYFQNVGILPWNIQVIDFPKMLDMEHLDPTLHKPVVFELDFDATAATYADSIRVNIEDLVSP